MPDCGHTWHFLTGEYPPCPGGVSDYCRELALALTAAGDDVQVWAPRQTTSTRDGVRVHGLPDVFGPASVCALDRALGPRARNERVLLHYVPQSFGYKGLNLPFCLWLAARRRFTLWVMFHEVAYPHELAAGLRQRLLATVQWRMAGVVARRADRVLVSVPRWKGMLESCAGQRVDATWVPIPSTVPTSVSAGAVEAVRRRLSPKTELLVGHFGTYHPLLAPILSDVFREVLAAGDSRRVLLLGRGASNFARAHFPATSPSRVLTPGDLSPTELAEHLAACDVVFQPYPDGVSARRTTVMASLALGVPVVTTEGPSTEPLWRTSGGVAIETPAEVPLLISRIEANPTWARQIGERGRTLYRQHFAMDRTVRLLREGGWAQVGAAVGL